MIRKDQLPDIWGDAWRLADDVPSKRFDVLPGSEMKILETSEEWLSGTVEGDLLFLPSLPMTELHVGEGARVEFYRLMGVNTPASHLTETRIFMQRGAQLRMNTITLGGGHVRHNVEVRLQGEECVVEADGLYLMDRDQQCDNYIFVEHACPNCTSRELYKGIIDDAARARFNGHVLVQDGATKTEAHQTNRNILLTDKAHVDTRPFLEIYNDDVKCSHGSTIGQLDEQALFYLMTRGISHRTAVTMLSYAFCDEVIRQIAPPRLREVVEDMVKKRLHGELTSCAECAISCSTPCNGPDAHFEIDPSKL